MSHFYRSYVPAAERRRKSEKKMAALRKKGEVIEPVSAATPRGKIAASYWGQTWCEHLESYSDFANRLPRGRTYLRNGSVLHLGIEKGSIHALVMGSELYRQTVRIDPLPPAKWQALKQRCQGGIGTLVELLQGKLSGEIMKVVTDRQNGLFPSPKEIRLDCDCPDWADLCKHLAAVLYGVGARLDDSPELLFKLRGVDHTELVQTDTRSLVSLNRQGSGRRRLSADAIADVFGVEMVSEDSPTSPDKKMDSSASSKPDSKSAPKRRARKAARKKPGKKRAAPKPSSRKTTTPFTPTGAAVRQLREQLGLSRSAFARELAVSAPTIANWEAKPGPIRLQARSLTALRKLHRRCQGG